MRRAMDNGKVPCWVCGDPTAGIVNGRGSCPEHIRVSRDFPLGAGDLLEAIEDAHDLLVADRRCRLSRHEHQQMIERLAGILVAFKVERAAS